MAASVKPVFLEQTGRRWRLCSASLSAFAMRALVGACLFAAGMFHPPLFPRIKVDDARVREQNESHDQTGLKGTLLKTAFARGNADVPAPARKPRANKPREYARPPVARRENREATIQALPDVIDRLRSDGYRFVSLHDLLGRSRDELMPRVSLSEWTRAEMEGGPLTLRGEVLVLVQWLFLAAIALTLLGTASGRQWHMLILTVSFHWTDH